MFRLANDSGKAGKWWDYIVRFGEECSMHDRTYNQACAEKVCASTDLGSTQLAMCARLHDWPLTLV